MTPPLTLTLYPRDFTPTRDSRVPVYIEAAGWILSELQKAGFACELECGNHVIKYTGVGHFEKRDNVDGSMTFTQRPLPTIPASKVAADTGNPDMIEVGEIAVYDPAGELPVGFGATEAEARYDAAQSVKALGEPPERAEGAAFLIVAG